MCRREYYTFHIPTNHLVLDKPLLETGISVLQMTQSLMQIVDGYGEDMSLGIIASGIEHLQDKATRT